MKNRYIVVEGIDGSGKTSIVKTIYKILLKFGVISIDLVHEPGGTDLSERLAKLLKDKTIKEKITYETELFLFYAARSQLVNNVIRPSIKNGRWILSDRNNLSSHAYQGGGRGLSFNLIQTLDRYILGNLKPDLVFYLDVSPEISLNRISNRFNIDRIEEESLNFFKRIRKSYLELILKNKKIIKINANQPLIQVKKNVHDFLLNWLILNEKKK